MNLSALLTSVGINSGLCFLFFTLYSILRKQPGNVTVYGPRRLVLQVNPHQITNSFNLERLLPTSGWVKRALEPTHDEILSDLGLDALIFTRVFIFSMRVFSLASVVGMFILLPVNYMGTEEFFDLQKISLDSFSISNVNDGSNKLWIHFCAIYIFTAFVCSLLYYEHKYISSKQIVHPYSSKPRPQEYTEVPAAISLFKTRQCASITSNSQQGIDPTQWLADKTRQCASIASNTQQGIDPTQWLAEIAPEPIKAPFKTRQYASIASNTQLGIDPKQWLAETAPEPVKAPFKTRQCASIASNTQQGIDPTQWLAETAPEPIEVHSPFFTTSLIRRWISNVVVFIAYIALTILYIVPVVLVQGLANLHQLETWFPFLRTVLNMKIVSQVITGYLPSLIFHLFLYIVPPIMLQLSSMQGFISHSQIEESACIKLLVFNVWNSFFANVLSGSALYYVNVFLEPKNIPRVLASAVPAQASFFISYVVTSGWTGLSSEIFRFVPILSSFMRKLFSAEDDKEFKVPWTPFCQEIPKVLFFGLLGTTYFFLSPLILPFLLVYYCLGYVIYRNQLLNVYATKYESGGNFWPIVHRSTIFNLVLMHIIAIGLFRHKELPLASSLTIPLPVLTILFSIYCQRRFLPNFKCDPTEYSRDISPEDQPLLHSNLLR